MESGGKRRKAPGEDKADQNESMKTLGGHIEKAGRTHSAGCCFARESSDRFGPVVSGTAARRVSLQNSV